MTTAVPSNDPIDALKSQMSQLQSLHAAGALSDAQFEEARATLEKRIVDAVVNAPPRAAAPQAVRAAPSKALLIGASVAVVAIAAAGYFKWGSPQAVGSADAAKVAGMASAGANAGAAAGASASAPAGGHPITSEQIQSMVDKLEADLKKNPQDGNNWAMLGRSYAMLGKHDLAAPALKKAMTFHPEDAGLVADYADALAVVNNSNLDGEPATLIDKALKTDGNNLKALSLAGTIAFNHKDYPGALRHWEKLAKLAPTSEYLQQIQGGIDEARSLSGLPPAPATAVAKAPAANDALPAPATGAAPAAAADKSAISGTVTLSASLAAKASPNDTLFVFARAAEGPRMPLAILRKEVKDLPLTFTLDDSLAMSPAMRLSSATRVVVGARISKRGDATAQPGDMQGLSAPMAPGATGLKLEITEVVGP